MAASESSAPMGSGPGTGTEPRTPALASREAHRGLPDRLTFCSWRLGWRALLLRGFESPAEVDDFATAPTPDQLVVLVTGGSCPMESFARGAWRRAPYRPGVLDHIRQQVRRVCQLKHEKRPAGA